MVLFPAVSMSGILVFPAATMLNSPLPTRTKTLEFFSTTAGVTVRDETELATVAL